MAKVTVYLGSAAGNSPVYADNAAELGRRLAREGVEIVYGGASVGTMWTMASAAIEAGGRVTGVFPKNFKGKKESRDRRIEVRAQGLAEMVETPDLASRVAKMTELGQACIVTDTTILCGSFLPQWLPEVSCRRPMPQFPASVPQSEKS